MTHHNLDGTMVAVTPEGHYEPEGEEGVFYLDSARNVVFKLNPGDASVTRHSDGPASSSEDVQNLKNSLTEGLNEYVKATYDPQKSLATVFVEEDGSDLGIRINISSHNLNLKNFWGGEWISTW